MQVLFLLFLASPVYERKRYTFPISRLVKLRHLMLAWGMMPVCANGKGPMVTLWNIAAS